MDLAFHHDFFAKQYEDYSLPRLKAKGMAQPTPESLSFLKDRLWKELVVKKP